MRSKIAHKILSGTTEQTKEYVKQYTKHIMETPTAEISREDLRGFIKDGYLFNFCTGHCMNNGWKNKFLKKEDIIFKLGAYTVTYDHEKYCFTFSHDVYFARIIIAGYTGFQYIGTESEVDETLEELLSEFDAAYPIDKIK